MRAEYDFENSQINPYKKAPREKITIQLNVDVIDYFKAESVRIGIPYQRKRARKRGRPSVYSDPEPAPLVRTLYLRRIRLCKREGTP